ncbi:hypothetical protein BJX62DRAFT_250648 [Aspergillus germanicus]
MTTTATQFHLFLKLPTEIRCMIWCECLPQRVVELDFPRADIIWDDDPPCRANAQITIANNASPLISRVCHEARAVFFRNGYIQPLPDHSNPDLEDFTKYMCNRPWRSPQRDSIHLNWEPWVDIDWETYDWGDPVRCVMWYAARTQSDQASIVMGLLQVFAGQRDPDRRHHHDRWSRSELAELMRKRTSWSVVILPPIVVHARPRATGGLFGLLADAPVQLVAVDDQLRMDRFMGLARDTPDVTISPRFTPDELTLAMEVLRDAVKAVFGSEDNAPTMQPAIMFRLCTRMCARSSCTS